MSELAAAPPASGLAGKVPPLNLPVGSVRALITLSVLGTVWAQQVRGADLTPLLRDTLLLVLGYYFGTRNATTAPPLAADALAGGAADRESNRKDPLFLPRGMIRMLIIVGFAGVAFHLFNQGKFDVDQPPPEFVLLGTFLGGSISRGSLMKAGKLMAVKVTNLLGHLLASGTLMVVLGYCGAIMAGMQDMVTAETSAAFAGVVGFYMGKR